MFCSHCGKELADGSLFCNFCGAKQAAPASASEPENKDVQNKNLINFTSTTCPNCSGQLKISVTTCSAYCPFCNSRFVLKMDESMEKAREAAIEIENLLADAKKYEKKSDVENALQCYKKVLSLDEENEEAKEGLARTRLLNYVYLRSKMSREYTLMELRKDSMTCHRKDGSKKIWLYRKMTDLSYFYGSIEFTYKGDASSTILLVIDEKEVVTFIRNAQKGIYPPIDKDLLDDED